jgi:hypothetical protein
MARLVLKVSRVQKEIKVLKDSRVFKVRKETQE